MTRAFVAIVVLLGAACQRREAVPPRPSATAAPPAPIVSRRDEEAAKAAREEQPCAGAVSLYAGAIDVAARDYTHFRGESEVKEKIPALGKVVSKSARLRFTLEYPFEKPFEGEVTAPITLRKIIDAVRAGFRKMYEGTRQQDIPGMYNKDVQGPYGRAFHAIDDLVIEAIVLCESAGTLEIDIGS